MMDVNTNRYGELSPAQQDQILRLVGQAAWGDTEYAISDLGYLLLRLLAATVSDADRWAAQRETGGADEFSVSDVAIDAMSDDDRLAYVGRLVRSLALRYGIGVGGPVNVLIADGSSPASILRGINDIVCLDGAP